METQGKDGESATAYVKELEDFSGDNDPDETPENREDAFDLDIDGEPEEPTIEVEEDDDDDEPTARLDLLDDDDEESPGTPSGEVNRSDQDELLERALAKINELETKLKDKEAEAEQDPQGEEGVQESDFSDYSEAVVEEAIAEAIEKEPEPPPGPVTNPSLQPPEESEEIPDEGARMFTFRTVTRTHRGQASKIDNFHLDTDSELKVREHLAKECGPGTYFIRQIRKDGSFYRRLCKVVVDYADMRRHVPDSEEARESLPSGGAAPKEESSLVRELMERQDVHQQQMMEMMQSQIDGLKGQSNKGAMSGIMELVKVAEVLGWKPQQQTQQSPFDSLKQLKGVFELLEDIKAQSEGREAPSEKEETSIADTLQQYAPLLAMILGANNPAMQQMMAGMAGGEMPEAPGMAPGMGMPAGAPMPPPGGPMGQPQPQRFPPPQDYPQRPAAPPQPRGPISEALDEGGWNLASSMKEETPAPTPEATVASPVQQRPPESEPEIIPASAIPTDVPLDDDEDAPVRQLPNDRPIEELPAEMLQHNAKEPGPEDEEDPEDEEEEEEEDEEEDEDAEDDNEDDEEEDETEEMEFHDNLDDFLNVMFPRLAKQAQEDQAMAFNNAMRACVENLEGTELERMVAMTSDDFLEHLHTVIRKSLFNKMALKNDELMEGIKMFHTTLQQQLAQLEQG